MRCLIAKLMKPLRILVGCECSGVVRRAFRARGHDAWSCDLKPAEDRDKHHLQCDVREALDCIWDMAIFFPDCTYLTVSVNGPITHGCNLYTAKEGQRRRNQAIEFFMLLARTRIERVAIENPVGIMSTEWRKPDQIIQPYEFGEDASKKTCLWLKNLPHLLRTKYVNPRMVCACGKVYRYEDEFKHGCPDCVAGKAKPRWSNQTDSGQNKLAPSVTRAADRARTYPGVAAAMAEQWNF